MAQAHYGAFNSLLLIEKLHLDENTLTETAKWYDLEPTVSAMYRRLHGEFTGTEDFPVILPSEAEYTALKEQYGIS
jgi:hypothetical protein